MSKNSIEDFTDKEDNDEDETEVEVPKERKLTPVVAEKKDIITVMPSLRDELFSIIKLVKDGKIDNGKAREIANLSQVIINTAKFELDCIKAFPDIKNKLLK